MKYAELGLSGELKSVPGMLLAAAHAARAGHEIFVPQSNADEVRILLLGAGRSGGAGDAGGDGGDRAAGGSGVVASSGSRARRGGPIMYAADHLSAVCAHLDGSVPLPVLAPPLPHTVRWISDATLDLSDVRGQLQAKRALTVAAAGSHSLLMIGPPGAGKSMLAMRLPSLLPPMTETEALEVAAIASVSGTGFNAGNFGRRPVRTPHHTTSAVALVGGGSRARPGEISLAHHGVLFLDELSVRGTCNCRVTNCRISSRSFCRFAADRTAVKTAIARDKNDESRLKTPAIKARCRYRRARARDAPKLYRESRRSRCQPDYSAVAPQRNTIEHSNFWSR